VKFSVVILLSASCGRTGVYADQNSTGGSNPPRSATQSELRRKSAGSYPEIRETCPFFAINPRQTRPERTDCSGWSRVNVPPFLRRSESQSGFQDVVGECNAITRWIEMHPNVSGVLIRLWSEATLDGACATGWLFRNVAAQYRNRRFRNLVLRVGPAGNRSFGGWSVGVGVSPHSFLVPLIFQGSEGDPIYWP